MAFNETPLRKDTTMLGNRAVSVQLVKTPKPRKDASDVTPDVAPVDVDKISNLVIEHTHNLAKIAGSAYIAKRVLDTVCQIAIIAAKKKI